MNRPKNQRRKNQKSMTHSSNAGEEKMSLAGFNDVEWPDVFPVKLVYNDMRALVAGANQATYQYRLNSVFDPDQTGVGGQPAGFDQLKALYGRYRVVAVRARVSLACMTSGGSGFLAIAPVDNASLTSIAEDVASLRHAGSAQASNNAKLAVVDKLWHIGELVGYSDESVLANTNLDAAVTANPGFQQYLLIAIELTGATDQCEIEVELTYYTRMEVPTAVEDASRRRSVRAQRWAAGMSNVREACSSVADTSQAGQTITSIQQPRMAAIMGSAQSVQGASALQRNLSAAVARR